MQNYNRTYFLFFFVIFFSLFQIILVSANNYTVDIFFTVPSTVYQTNERIALKGFIFLGNYSSNGSLVTNSSGFANAVVNLTIKTQTELFIIIILSQQILTEHFILKVIIIRAQ